MNILVIMAPSRMAIYALAIISISRNGRSRSPRAAELKAPNNG